MSFLRRVERGGSLVTLHLVVDAFDLFGDAAPGGCAASAWSSQAWCWVRRMTDRRAGGGGCESAALDKVDPVGVMIGDHCPSYGTGSGCGFGGGEKVLLQLGGSSDVWLRCPCEAGMGPVVELT